MSQASEAPPKKRTVKTHLFRYINARHPIVAVSTNDEERFLRDELRALSSVLQVPRIYRWDATGVLTEKNTQKSSTMGSLRELILWFARPKSDDSKESADLVADGAPRRSVLLVFDAMSFLNDDSRGRYSNAAITRELKNMSASLIDQNKTIFLIGSFPFVPPELTTTVPLLDYPLPDLDYLVGTVQSMGKAFAPDEERRSNPNAGLSLTEEKAQEIAKMLLGYRDCEARTILIGSVLANMNKRSKIPGHPVEFDIDHIREAKLASGKDNSAIQIYIPERKVHEIGTEEMKMVGGGGAIKSWFLDQMQLMTPAARDEGIDMPKGAVIFGMGGTGKDWLVENFAKDIGWAYMHMDFGATKDWRQGSTHQNFRRTLQFAEDQSPCFLIVSEWEKMMAGAMTPESAACDGGTNAEILATWLNWTQRRTAPVFIWGITNDISNLSQASLRAGRWDKVWFMDLPNRIERAEIFKVHLERTGWNPENFDLDFLAVLTDGCVGAEIRSIVNEALIHKFVTEGPRTKAPLTMEHLKYAIERAPVTAKMRPGDVKALRDFAKLGGYPVANTPISGITEDLAGELEDLAKNQSK